MNSIPSTVGIAADIIFIETSPREFLSNCLAVYDRVAIAVEPSTLSRLADCFGCWGVYELVKAGRIELCPAYTSKIVFNKDTPEFTKDAFVDDILQQKSHWPFTVDEIRVIERLMGDHLITPAVPRYRDADGRIRKAEESFVTVARMPGYEALDRNRQSGLLFGLSRMNDLIQVGYLDFEMDKELPLLLSCAFPGSGQPSLRSEAVLTTLHQIVNLPALGTMATQEGWSDERLVEILLSPEGDQLRRWIQENLSDGLDVRDAYMASERAMPSKNKWLGWLRFGSVTAVSTALSTLVSGPVAGAVAGAAVGAIDQAYGARLLDSTSRSYHPKRWLSFIESARRS